MTNAPQELTMAAHARMLARSADALAKELSKLTNPRGRDRGELAWLAQLADIVADLAGSLQDRIDREDRKDQP